MKIKFLIAGLFGLITTTAFAQKGELSNAKEAFEKYDALRSTGTSLATTSLAEAKTAIDKASANAKTSGLAQTYAIKAGVYAAYALQDTVTATSVPLFNTSEEALKKAKELDTKNEFSKLTENASLTLAQVKLNEGVKNFKDQKFDQAYKAFDYYRQVLPEDTNALYYTGLAASASENYPAAITSYKKLLTTNFSQNDKIYFDLSSIYLVSKDTTAALKSVTDGIEKFPKSADLRKREIEISLQSGKQQEVLGKIQTAIANDPKNKSLFFYAGLTYAQLAESISDEAIKTKDAAAKTALLAKKSDAFGKAAEMYKKATEIDPEYFDAVLNLGYVTISPAIDLYNAANQLPANKQKEYDAAVAKATAQFELAKPALIKATELQPKSVDALTNLKMYYLGTKNTVQANEIQKRIAALKQ